MNLPPVLEQRWLAYHYTKLGRVTYFGQWTPPVPDQRWLAYHYTKLADGPTLANEPPSTRAEMTCIPLHQTWQMNLLWSMNPPVPEQRWLAYHYTKLGRWTYFGQWTPPVPEQRWLAYHYTKLGRWTYFGQWSPQYQSRDDLHTTTQNLADEPTLANGPSSTRAEMTCIPLHKTWQMNLLCLNTMAKVWKL